MLTIRMCSWFIDIYLMHEIMVSALKLMCVCVCVTLVVVYYPPEGRRGANLGLGARYGY